MSQLTFLQGLWPAVFEGATKAEALAVARSWVRARWAKTRLALEMADTRPSVYLDLESEPYRAKLAEPELYLARHADTLVILDEI